ncbi:serine/threonine-protein kinase [Sanguibacter suaedae]|uniref:Serine/threonine protein kinase n=1 Tax=Sanguibacter suaedae TaxID=2795737 RepID=A0A934IBK4_9MICO|nr:serine/threonine-protein kinase [Sanguibacter suaedae]MBI9114861.1 serine/threonine protein kinase [Sanguibacter suaedae]
MTTDVQTVLEAGSTVADRYVVEALLGRGGTAAVYRARDQVLGRAVALKVFAPGTTAPHGARERAEVDLLASFHHPSLVTLFDVCTDADHGGERPVLVMELVEGPHLGERIAQGPLARVDVARMAGDLAEALHAVHEAGVVHRDIKPGNVLLGPSLLPTHEFRARLADFGIAYLVDSTRLTAEGILVGTPAYLSPEQARGEEPSPAGDVYSLGLVLLESLTRERAFDGPLLEALAARLSSDPHVPGHVGYGWKSLLAAMTARDPADRPTPLDVVVRARALEAEDEAGATGAVAAGEASATGPVPVVATSSALPTGAVERSTQDLPADPPPAAATVPGPRGDHQHRSRARSWVALLVAVPVLAVGAVLWQGRTTDAPSTPELPAVEAPLDDHLSDLMTSVTP